MATVSTPMTAEELLNLPDDGELRERPMTKRNRFHSYTMTRVAKSLDNWLDNQRKPRGQVLSGAAGVRLKRNPDTTLGVDIVYVSAEILDEQTKVSTIIYGVPVLNNRA